MRYQLLIGSELVVETPDKGERNRLKMLLDCALPVGERRKALVWARDLPPPLAN